MKNIEELKRIRKAAWDAYAKAKWVADDAYDAARAATDEVYDAVGAEKARLLEEL